MVCNLEGRGHQHLLVLPPCKWPAVTSVSCAPWIQSTRGLGHAPIKILTLGSCLHTCRTSCSSRLSKHHIHFNPPPPDSLRSLSRMEHARMYYTMKSSHCYAPHASAPGFAGGTSAHSICGRFSVPDPTSMRHLLLQ